MNGARSDELIRWFDDISYGDVAEVGGKNASLGEMYRELGRDGIKVPHGFAITVSAYRYHLEHNGLVHKIHDVLDGLDTANLNDLQDRAARVRQMIVDVPLPASLETGILAAYSTLSGAARQPIDVAVRSSATTEDLPDASFAGQQDTFLNVRGRGALLETVKACFASLFTDRAISYRHDKGFDGLKIGLSVGVQKMVRSDLASSGVLFTLDTETGFRRVVLINAAYGLGETVVRGLVNPDEYCVFKATLLAGKRPVLQKRCGTKEFKLIYDTGGGKRTRTVGVSDADRNRLVLNDDEILQLAVWGCKIEEHYSRKRGVPTPMDIEWAKDGESGELFIVQARPETVHSGSASRGGAFEIHTLDQMARKEARVLVTGRAVGEKIGSGRVRVVKTVKDLNKVGKGDVLVADKTDPDWEPSMKLASAIVTDRGGRTCHAAIVSRELGIPAVVGAETSTETLRDGQLVTVSCAEGEAGRVYEGALPFKKEALDLSNLKSSFTKIMMNVANPSEAFRLQNLPNDGVGLARMEFIISNAIKIHPMALIDFDKLEDQSAKNAIARLTAGYSDKREYFVDQLAQGVGMIGAAFHPRDVIVRLSDFKTNEYANLLGGKGFEPIEENPMLGFRGASRYYDERYRRGFALECRALKRVRDEMGLTNVKVMVPFCRTVDEGKRVIAEMAANGLRQGDNGLEVYAMCEIPSNVVLADEFLEIFDGYSIGSNDLTQLILGVDRDSAIVAPLFDERNAAVTRMIEQVIEVARRKRKKIGICGQAPSDYPEFAAMLVRMGIDSISLNPDSVIKTLRLVATLEETAGDR